MVNLQIVYLSLLCFVAKIWASELPTERLESGNFLAGRDNTAICPGDGGTTYTDNNGYTYYLSCDDDVDSSTANILSYNNFNSFADCLSFCSTYNNGNPDIPCAAASLSGAVCYLKSAGFVLTKTGSDSTAILNSGPAVFTATNTTVDPTCNGDDRLDFTDSLNITYELFCSSDGNPNLDVAYTQQDSILDCAASCSEYNMNNTAGPTCIFALKFKGTTDCYLKSSAHDPAALVTSIYFDIAFPIRNNTLDAQLAAATASASIAQESAATASASLAQELAATASASLAQESASAASASVAQQSAATASVSVAEESASAASAAITQSPTLASTTDSSSSVVTTSSVSSPSVTAVACPANLTGIYTDPDNFDYLVSLIPASNVTVLLQASNQTSACACAEQCSVYNEAVPAPQIACAGIEYNPEAIENCLVKSN